MAAQQYQRRIHRVLARIFGGERVRSEWNIRTDASDLFENSLTYAPRVDIAVGPFNVTPDSINRDVGQIIKAAGHCLIQDVIAAARSQNDRDFIEHQNPRCLLAIEIEFSGSSKHILGDITNASMMGFIGVVVGPSDNMRKIERVAQYVRILRSVKKGPPSLFANVAYFEARQFASLLRRHLPKATS